MQAPRFGVPAYFSGEVNEKTSNQRKAPRAQIHQSPEQVQEHQQPRLRNAGRHQTLMPCGYPRDAYKPAAGGPLKFNQPRNGRAYIKINIPCGTCILCRQEQARQWGVRITHEAQLHEQSCFMTLTYSEENIPAHNSLDYSDLCKFWKRLRKNYGKLRYYAVGEYGDETLRPHYHACLFGHDFTEQKTIIRESPTRLWTNQALEDAWGLGLVSVGALNFQTAQYTASYVLKKLKTGKQYVRTDEETGELIPLVQPRPFMSRNLAREWWERYGSHVTAHDLVVINGKKQKPPQAYDRWLGKEDKTILEKIKERRQDQAPKLTPEQNRARARNAHAHAKQKSKSV